MSISIIPTNSFTKELKRLSKKYPGVLTLIAELSNELKKEPKMGSDLGQNVYKIRRDIPGTKTKESLGAQGL